MTQDFGTHPIDFEAYKKAKAQLDQDELKQMEYDLKKIFVAAYAPESTWWHRNHTDVAEWYWIWEMNKGEIILTSTPNDNSFFYEKCNRLQD